MHVAWFQLLSIIFIDLNCPLQRKLIPVRKLVYLWYLQILVHAILPSDWVVNMLLTYISLVDPLFTLSPGSCWLQLRSVSIDIRVSRCSVNRRCQSGTEPDVLNSLLWLYSLYVLQSLKLYCHVKGIQAQTMANFYLAFEAQLTIIPVINKVPTVRAVFGFITRYFATWILCVG